MKKRFDQHIVDERWAPSRSKAREMIQSGCVQIQRGGRWTTIKKPGLLLRPPFPPIKLENPVLLKYVSRGGLKLEAALKTIGLPVKGLVAMDVGISTGGFTDCLLQAGAKSVLGIDVAEGELAQTLKTHPRLEVKGGTNVRHIDKIAQLRERKFDLIVVDLSFISITKVLPVLLNFLKARGRLLALVKPQFEVGAKKLNKKGVVKSQDDLRSVEEKVCAFATEIGYHVSHYFPCAIKGGDGNQEYFLYANKAN